MSPARPRPTKKPGEFLARHCGLELTDRGEFETHMLEAHDRKMGTLFADGFTGGVSGNVRRAHPRSPLSRWLNGPIRLSREEQAAREEAAS